MTMNHFILYVQDQERSTTFYGDVLDMEPELNVPGMTEFRLAAETILGLMSSAGIERLLGAGVGNAAPVPGMARGELYLVVDEAESYHSRAVNAGARELSPLLPRDWGHDVAYSMDVDGYVLAFASRVLEQPK
jgi:catechol 2,3-dioxygenase-like lactoylglutathione lyase family enzyme